AVNFAYILYLRGRAEATPAADLERLVRRWYAMSVLRGRYAGSHETAFDFDIRQVDARGLAGYTDAVIENELPDSFWTGMLPQVMDTSSAQSPYFLAYQVAQVKLGDKGFLSRDITVLDLLMNRTDVHHVYPKKFLKDQGLPRSRYNQIANFVLAQPTYSRTMRRSSRRGMRRRERRNPFRSGPDSINSMSCTSSWPMLRKKVRVGAT